MTPNIAQSMRLDTSGRSSRVLDTALRHGSIHHRWVVGGASNHPTNQGEEHQGRTKLTALGPCEGLKIETE
jgi:hypothetical protein